MKGSGNECDVVGGNLNALDGLESSFLRDNSQLVEAYENIDWKSVQSLNALVGSVEQVVIKYKNPNEKIKRAIETIYLQLLQRYPLFFGYWKRFTAVQYQLNGLAKSIATLGKAVEAFPNSLELWCDYLNVLCANNAGEVELIRKNFRIAKDRVGYQFLSHPFWDKYIDFETKHEAWDHLSDIYAELVTIPIHQYAKYDTAYKSFLISANSPKKEPDLEVKLRNTQKIVSLIWPFESKIKQSFFNITPVSEEELSNWDEYLKFLTHNQLKHSFSSKLIKATFERCLVPCLYYEHYWIMYADWSEQVQPLDLHTNIELYQRGMSMLPMNLRQFRFKFLTFLQKNYRNEKDYIFLIFGQTISSIIKLYPYEALLLTEYLAMLRRHRCGTSIDEDDKVIYDQLTSYSKELESAIKNYINHTVDKNALLQCLINDLNLPIIVVELIKTTWLVLKNTMQTRKYFNFYSKNRLFQSSVAFWLTYYKFEKSNQNFARLNKFVNDLGVEIFLPLTIMNDILNDYRSFYLANSNAGVYQTVRNGDDGGSEFHMMDPILLIQLKLNNPQWYPGRYKQSLDWHRSREFRENGHPNILDDKPQISNTVLDQTTKIFGNRQLPLPTFRNLERINQPLKHDDIFSKYYLDTNR